MSEYEFGIIGGGNMGQPIIAAAINSGAVVIDKIVVAEPNPERRETLSGELGVACVEDNLVAAACPKLLLAVKPQIMGTVIDADVAQIITDAAGAEIEMTDPRRNQHRIFGRTSHR